MAEQVVITRPRDEAGRLARQLEARGYEPLIEPILEIVSLDVALPQLDPYSALVFTSANGVRAFAALSSQRDLPAYAVGSGTAAVLREAGFRTVRDAAGDAAGLADLIHRTRQCGPVLHLSGRAVARDLGSLLAPAGIRVDRVALYDAQPAAALSQDLTQALYACTVGNVLFFSARTATIFGTLVSEAGLGQMVGSVTACCLSGQVAAAAACLFWKRVAVAELPTTEALLALLPFAEGAVSHGC